MTEYDDTSTKKDELLRILDLITQCADQAESVEEAAAYFDQASSMAANSPGLQLEIAARLSRVFLQIGPDRSLAERIIKANRRALELGVEPAKYQDGEPIYPWEPYANMAFIYLILRDFEPAMEMLERAKEAGMPYSINEANWYRDQGRHEEAIAVCERIYKQAEGDPQTQLMCLTNIANSLKRLGRYVCRTQAGHPAQCALR